MPLKSLALGFTSFLALAPSVSVAAPQWTINGWQQDSGCQGNADISISGNGTTTCLNTPFPPQSFEFLGGEIGLFNVHMCLDQNCGNCQTLGPNVCWPAQQNGEKGATFQIITANM